MNKRQRSLLIESLIVLGLAAAAVTALINLKDWTNRREALRAMVNISQQIQAYRRTHSSLPPQDYINNIRESVPGRARLGKLEYRAQSIKHNSPDNAILAYTQQSYRSLFIDSGHVVLFRNGQVSWMTPDQFATALAQHKSSEDVQTDATSENP